MEFIYAICSFLAHGWAWSVALVIGAIFGVMITHFASQDVMFTDFLVKMNNLLFTFFASFVIVTIIFGLAICAGISLGID